VSLARLTIDLVANLSQFEGDFGRAAQVVTRDSEKMSRAAATFQRALEKQAEQAGKTASEFLSIKAAELGLGEETQRLIDKITSAGATMTRAGAAGTAAFNAVTKAAETAGISQKSRYDELVTSIRTVNTEAAKLRASAVADEKAGTISPEVLKSRLGNIDAGRLDAIRQLKAAAAEQVAAADADAAAAAKKSAFVESVKREADAIGKTRSELLALKAATIGVTAEASPYIARLAEAERRGKSVASTAALTTVQLQTLKYTLSDVAASLGSGASPFTVLLQQGGQVAQIEGGLSGLFRGIVASISPARAAMGAAAGAVAAVGFAFYEGSKQGKAFADSLVLTGNYAGQTEASFNRLAKSIAASGEVNIAAAREYTQALISTGQIGPEVLDKAANAAARYGKATGQTADAVAKDFAGMSSDVLTWATEHNKSLNFVTFAQLQQIKTLQETNRTVEAQAVVYDALNQRLNALEPNLGTIEKLLRGGANAWHGFWDAAYDIGRTDTVEDKLARVEAKLAERRERGPLNEGTRAAFNRGNDRLENERNELLTRRGYEIAAAAAAAQDAELTKKAADASAFVDGYLKRAKSVESLEKALKNANAQFEALARKGQPVSEKNQKIILDQIREEFKPPQTEDDQVRKAALQRALKVIEDGLQRERDARAFHEQLLQGHFNASEVSLADYFKQRVAITEQGTAAELAASDARIEKLRAALSATKDRSDRVSLQGQIDDETAKREQARSKAAQQVILANQAEAAAYRVLGDRVAEFQAQLVQLEGNEFLAAQLRTLQALEVARRSAKEAGGLISQEELDRQRAAMETAARFAEAQRLQGQASADAARAEELFLLQAERRGASLQETERGVAEIRRGALEQLRALTEAAQRLAEASSDPKVKQFAADIALQYLKAAEAVDPALQRLRESNKSLAASIAGDISTIATEGKKLPDVFNAIVADINKSIAKVAITDPIQKQLEGVLRKATEGDGGLGGIFGKILGIGGGGGTAAATGDAAAATAKAAESAAITATTTSLVSFTAAGVVPATFSLELMAQAANTAAFALSQIGASGGTDAAGNLLSSLFGSDGGGADFAANPFAAVALADGTNYVPRDGFPATLHEGEAVVPKKYNPAAGGQGSAGRPVNIVVNNTAGEVVTARAHDRGDGDIEVTVRRIVRDENARDLAGGGGPISSGLKARGINLSKALPRRS
jgi:hypothetical protein